MLIKFAWCLSQHIRMRTIHQYTQKAAIMHVYILLERLPLHINCYATEFGMFHEQKKEENLLSSWVFAICNRTLKMQFATVKSYKENERRNRNNLTMLSWHVTNNGTKEHSFAYTMPYNHIFCYKKPIYFHSYANAELTITLLHFLSSDNPWKWLWIALNE